MLNEVAPPGFGHTKSGKGDKKGGTAAAFDRARKEGRFKGSKSDMFAIMWSQKKKGDKPHYKPGTNKKYKKYQEESKMPNVDPKDKKVIKDRAKNLFKRDLKGTVLGVNEEKCDGCKCSGCGPGGVGHQNPCVECGGHHKEKVNEKYGDTFDTSKQKKKDAAKEKENTSRDLRMKHGKKWRDYSDAVVAAKKREKDRLKPGEVKKLVKGKWVSNKR
jgi:hypothetical protein